MALAETAAGVAPDHTVADARDAMARAADGFRAWRAVATRVRALALIRLADGLLAEREALAALVSREMGKPLVEARGEVDYAASFAREYGELAARVGGRTGRRADGTTRFETHAEPVGPVVVVTPWNFPLAMAARKVAPALAAGCSTVVKPSDLAPLSMLAFARIAHEAGVPDDVLQVVTTLDSPAVVAELIDHPAAAKLSFTGSTQVGRALAEHGGRRLLRMSMELGGNAPFVVFGDADLDAAVDGLMVAKFRNGGQTCVAANRIYVEAAVLDAFLERLLPRVAALVCGDPGDPATTLGPMVSATAARRIRALVARAEDGGARVLHRGTTPGGDAYVPATVLLDAREVSDEIFGPVAVITPFDDEAAVVAAANATRFGLAAYVYSRDHDRLRRVAFGLETGMVGCNTAAISDASAPFGGIKDSGFGREGGPEGLEEYLQLRYLAIPEARA